MASRQRRGLSAGGLAALLLTPAPASAHLASTGLGPVYDGAWHLVLSPAPIATFAALAFHAARCGPAVARRVFLFAPLLWAAAWVLVSAAPAPLAGAFALLAAGLLLAADQRRAPQLATAGLLGIAAIAGAGYDGLAAPATVAGALGVLWVLLALAASLALPLRRFEAIVALRVAGSWTAALGLLLIGWWLRGRTA